MHEHRRPIISAVVSLILCGFLAAPFVEPPLAAAAVNQITAHPDGGVNSFYITRDGQRVVYWLLTGQGYSLRSAALSGGPSARLAGVVPPPSDQGTIYPQAYAVSPDGQTVVYFGLPPNTPTPTPAPSGSTSYAGFGLYRVPIDGSGPSNLIIDDSHIRSFDITPDGQRVVFTRDDAPPPVPPQQPAYLYGLYSVPMTGGQYQRLNIDLPANRSVAASAGVLATGRAVYRVGSFSKGQLGETIGAGDVYSVPANGPISANVKLNRCGPLTGISFSTAGGTRFVYQTDDCDGNGVLRSTATDGSGSETRLSPAGVVGTLVSIRLSPDGRHLFLTYSEQVSTSWRYSLYTVPTDGPSTAAHLIQSGDLAGLNPAPSVLVSWNSEWVAYTSAGSPPYSLYVSSRTGPSNTPRLVTGNLGPAGYAFSGDSRYLIYPEAGDTYRSLDLTTAASPVSLGLAGLQYTYASANTNATRVLFVTANGGGNLFAIPPAGPASALVQINHAVVPYYSNPKLTPDGRRVVYVSDGQLFVSDLNEAFTAATPVYVMPQGCVSTPQPIPSQGPTRTPFPTQYAVYMPSMNRCDPAP